MAPLIRYAGRLRFPWLFAITVCLLILDLLVPDMVPFVDEILLGLGALLLGSWRHRREQKQRPTAELDADKTPLD
jgi:hypothetical protein